MILPLHAVRILDLTNVLAGPFCTYRMALMDAEVIKIEQPGRGDLARHLGADPAAAKASMGASYDHLSVAFEKNPHCPSDDFASPLNRLSVVGMTA